VPLETTDKQVAQQRLAKIVSKEQRKRAGLYDSESNGAIISIDQALTDFRNDLERRGRRPKYIADVKRFITIVAAHSEWKTLADVNPKGFLEWSAANRTKAPKTLNKYLAAWNAFLNWLVARETIERNPLAKVEKAETRGRERRIRRALSIEELQRLIAAAPPNRALVYLAAVLTGIRRSELSSITWADLKLDAPVPCIVVGASISKNKKTEAIPLHPDLVEKLGSMKRGKETDIVFAVPSRMHHYKADLEAAGIAYIDAQGQQADFHALRHTFATLLQATGSNQAIAMQAMRHSDPRLTAVTYTDETQLPVAEAISRLPSVVASPDDSHIRTQELGAEVRGRYWAKGAKGRWNSYTAKQYYSRLNRLGRWSFRGPGGAPSEIESDIEAVTERQAIVTEGISGFRSGIHEFDDRLFLAKFGYKMIEPDPSTKPIKTIDFFEQLLGVDAMERFLDWLCFGVMKLKDGERGQSRVLVVAGPAGGGKSLIVREFARQMLGGRSADAAPWLLGTTEFASELGAAELLYVDDALGDSSLKTRLRAAARIKEIVTAGNKLQPIHAKGKDRYYQPVWWRLAIALNDTPEALSMLPPLDEGFADKVILLRAQETVLSKRGDRAARHIEEMLSELPGLMAYVLDRGIQGQGDGRGPLAWQDPVLAGKLRETAPEYALAGMIIEAIERRGGAGIALPIINPPLAELACALRDACGERYTRLCQTDRRMLTYLQRLEQDGAVASFMANGKKRWRLENLDQWLQKQHADADS